MNLSPNFTLAEVVASQTAAREGIDNTPSDEVIFNASKVAYTLEIVRLHLNAPVYPSSWYRCLELNDAIKGADNSTHMLGTTVDFIVRGYTPREVVQAIRYVIGYNKIILEFNSWVHLEISDSPDMEVLEAKKIDNKTVYEVFNGGNQGNVSQFTH